jgi:NAD(P)H-dependent flavin oxidoreductase YrpB (nitropropane dioxygenase family)
MWASRFTERYGIELPLVSAGMGEVAGPALAAAVSEAGGLGFLAGSPGPPAALAAAIAETRRRTARPFGVNLLVDDSVTDLGTEGHIDVCREARVPVVSFHWHRPPDAWVERLHAAGARAWMQVGSLRAAREAAAHGFDALLVQGAEAGGHNRSRAGLVALVPAVVDACAPLPVVAAGGIADGRGVAAALALGADAVSVGTRFVASREAHAHPEWQRRIVAASVDDVARTCIFGPEWPDQPMKVIRNRVVAEWEGRGERTPWGEPPREIGRRLVGPEPYAMPRFSALLPTPDTTGDFDEMCLAAGESAGLVGEVEPAGAIVRRLMEEARAVIAGRLAPLVS